MYLLFILKLTSYLPSYLVVNVTIIKKYAQLYESILFRTSSFIINDIDIILELRSKKE